MDIVATQGNHFGRLLRQYRKAARLTQEELAERSGMSVRAISDMERGRRHRPYRQSVLRLGDALQLPEFSRAELALAATAAPSEAGDAAGQAARPGRREREALAQWPEPALPTDSRLPLAVVPRQLPRAVGHFVSREAPQQQLDSLADQLGHASGAVAISVISGTAGAGKTALAVHWAQQAADRFPGGQLYVNLHGFDPSGEPMTAGQAMRGFLDALQVPPGQIPADLTAQAALYRSVMAGRSMLIVLDNARDAEQVRPLLPGSPGCFTVVTSRNQLPGLLAAEGACLLTIGALTQAEARELLAGRLGAERVAREPGAVTELIELCGRLALALSIAAAQGMARPLIPLAELAAGLRDAASRLAVLDTGDAATSPRSVFSWSYQSLSDPAARMFRLLGLHVASDFSAEATASLAGAPVTEAARLLSELARASLISEVATGRFALHDLLRAFAAEQSAAAFRPAERQAAVRRLLDHYVHTAHAADCQLNPSREPISVAAAAPRVVTSPISEPGQSMSWFEAEHQVLVAAIRHAAGAGFDRHAWQIAWSLVTFFDRRGFWPDWAATQELALTASQRLGDRRAEALAQRNGGRAQLQLGLYADADQCLRLALELLRQLGDRVGQARTHQDIGRSLSCQGRHREALDQDLKAFDLYRAEGHAGGEANALNAIGWDLAQLGEYSQALIYCQQALDLCRQTGIRHGEAATLDSLGYAHHQLGHQAQALACYQLAHDLSDEIGDTWGRALALDHVGDVHHGAGDDQRACQAWRQAMSILAELQHPDADQIRAKLLAASRD